MRIRKTPLQVRQVPRVRRWRTDHIRILPLAIEVSGPEYRRAVAVAVGLGADARPVGVDLGVGWVAVCFCDCVGGGGGSVESVDVGDHGGTCFWAVSQEGRKEGSDDTGYASKESACEGRLYIGYG